jgi:glycosyltransferase involved in cell wall biosynthesis
LSTILFDLKCLWHARQEFDVVYMLGYGSSLFCFMPRIWGAKVWINMDGIEWARSKWNAVAKLWFRVMEAVAMWTANVVIADAEGIKDHLLSRHSRRPTTVVIPYGANKVEVQPDEGLLAEWQLHSEEYYLVVCRLEPENHIFEIVEGFIQSDSSATLVIVGDHKSGTPYVEKIVRQSDERIRFLGTVFDAPKLEALRWYCRAYLHGHSVGGTNPSLLEALACGNRILAHDNVFNREVGGDCSGYFSSSAELSELIREIDSDRNQESHRQAAQRRVDEIYSWGAVTRSYAELLNKM